MVKEEGRIVATAWNHEAELESLNMNQAVTHKCKVAVVLEVPGFEKVMERKI